MALSGVVRQLGRIPRSILLVVLVCLVVLLVGRSSIDTRDRSWKEVGQDIKSWTVEKVFPSAEHKETGIYHS